MVIDDNPRTTVEFLERDLTVAVVKVATTGEEALAFLGEHAKSEPAWFPDVILLDINMPGMSGFEVLKAIKADDGLRQIPVVMHSTSPRREDVIRAYANGASGYVPKAIDPDESERLYRLFAEYWGTVSLLPSGCN